MRNALLAVAGVAASFVGGCRAASADAALASRLDRSFFDDRFTIGRLAGQPSWRPCVFPDSSAIERCAGAPRTQRSFSRLAAASRAARQRLDTDSSAEALHDAGLLALRLRDSIPTGLADALRLLTRARQVAPSNPEILNDFAVVQLETGEREQTVRPLLAALDAIERALAVDSTSVPALFNRALILERLYLVSTAPAAWERYLRVERDHAWEHEAEEHQASLTRILGASPLAQGGRDTVFQFLGDWGQAYGEGNEKSALAALDGARRVVAGLDTVKGDQSVRLAVALVDSLRRLAGADHVRSPLRRLAAAYAELDDGRRAYLRAAYELATGPLDHAADELRALGSPVAGWASLYLASSELNRGQYDAADKRLQQVVKEATDRQPALKGKGVWTRGVIEVRRGHFEAANAFYRAAAPYLDEANEQDNAGAIAYLVSESLSSEGQYAAGHAEAYRGLRLLAPYRKSVFLGSHLRTVAAYARADSLPYAALCVMNEVIAVTRASDNNADPLVYAYVIRARDLVAVGRRDSARAELTTAVRLAGDLTGRAQERSRADIHLVQGLITRADDPGAALPLLESVANDYRRLGAFSRASAALYEAAVAARDGGDTVRARAWLGEAIAQIERQQATV
ncbi:MAG: hypothetical protein ACREPM_11975, partial [Gemmatimonadaceae bacterium]